MVGDGGGDDDLEASYRALGRYFYEFSGLENSIRSAVHRASGADYHSFLLITGSLTAQPLTDAFVALCKISDRVDEQGMLVVRGRQREINEVIPMRNDLAHGWWISTADVGGSHLWRTKPARATPIDVRQYSVAELEEQSDRMIRLRTCVDAVRSLRVYRLRAHPGNGGRVAFLCGGGVRWRCHQGGQPAADNSRSATGAAVEARSVDGLVPVTGALAKAALHLFVHLYRIRYISSQR